MLSDVKIANKIYVVIALMALLTAILGGIAASAIVDCRDAGRQMKEASDRALAGAKVDALILSVVMDTRGIYMSANSGEAEKFAKPMEASLAALDAALQRWTAMQPADQVGEFATLASAVGQFQTLRREMIRLARQDGPAATRLFGDRDEARQNRQAVNRMIEEATDRQNQAVAATEAALANRSNRALLLVGGTAAIAVLAGVGLAGAIARRSICRPLLRLAGQM